MLTRSQSKKNKLPDVVVNSGQPVQFMMSSFNRISSFKYNKQSNQDFQITPFDVNVQNEPFFSEEQLNKSDVSFKRTIINSELINNLGRNTNKIKLEKQRHLLSKKFRSNWTKEEEISFLAICLIHEHFNKKIKLSYLTQLLITKNYSQFYQHFYKKRKVLSNFYKIFFSFFDCSNINNVELLEYTLEELFNILKSNLLNDSFIRNFTENVKDKNTIKFFQNIFSCHTFIPTLFIDRTLSQSSNKKENYETSPLSINKQYKLSSDGKRLSSFKNNLKNNNLDYSNKKICDFKIKHIKVNMEEDFYEKIRSISSYNKTVILDNNFLVNYIISKFKSSGESLKSNKS
jgi:hypothetical protein